MSCSSDETLFEACGEIDSAINKIADILAELGVEREQAVIPVIETCIEGLQDTIKCCKGQGILDHLVERFTENTKGISTANNQGSL